MIFIDNKYTRLYFKIINRANSKRLSEYSENHHIIPESFFINRSRKGPAGWLNGNPEDSSNIVSLTAREHFICHWLLIKMTTGDAKHKMIFAITMMKRKGTNQQNRYNTMITSRVYAIYKEQSAKIKSEIYFGRVRNKTLYTFCHSNGTVETCSILELSHKYNLERSSIAHLVKKPFGKHHVKGWSINHPILDTARSVLYSGSGGPKYDHTVYSFKHKSGITEQCTKYDLFSKYNLARDGIYYICNGKQKSSQGWFLDIR
jgi:hypothetical protein